MCSCFDYHISVRIGWNRLSARSQSEIEGKTAFCNTRKQARRLSCRELGMQTKFSASITLRYTKMNLVIWLLKISQLIVLCWLILARRLINPHKFPTISQRTTKQITKYAEKSPPRSRVVQHPKPHGPFPHSWSTQMLAYCESPTRERRRALRPRWPCKKRPSCNAR